MGCAYSAFFCQLSLENIFFNLNFIFYKETSGYLVVPIKLFNHKRLFCYPASIKITPINRLHSQYRRPLNGYPNNNNFIDNLSNPVLVYLQPSNKIVEKFYSTILSFVSRYSSR